RSPGHDAAAAEVPGGRSSSPGPEPAERGPPYPGAGRSAARSVPLGDRLASLVEHGPARQAHRPGRRATGERCRDRGLLVETRDRATQREPAPTLGPPLRAPTRREQVEPPDQDRVRHGPVDE